MFTQEWTADIRDKERYEMYRSFKVMIGAKKYLSVIDLYCFRVAVTQLRLGVLPINSNMYRYSDCPTNKNCVFCQNQVENEDHFLWVCPLYTDLRNRFLEQKGIQSLRNILRRKNTKYCRLLSMFIFCAVNRRKLYVDVWSPGMILTRNDSPLLADTHYFVVIYHHNVSLSRCDCLVRFSFVYCLLFVCLLICVLFVCVLCCLYVLFVCLCA